MACLPTSGCPPPRLRNDSMTQLARLGLGLGVGFHTSTGMPLWHSKKKKKKMNSNLLSKGPGEPWSLTGLTSLYYCKVVRITENPFYYGEKSILLLSLFHIPMLPILVPVHEQPLLCKRHGILQETMPMPTSPVQRHGHWASSKPCAHWSTFQPISVF